MKSVSLISRDAKLDPPDFLFAITRIAVAQICQSVGFKASKKSALQTLTDITARYLQMLAKYAAASAATSGRTQSNFFDIIIALEDLYSAQGFRGASNVNQPLLASSILVDILKFVKYTDEIPFAKPISHYYMLEQSLLPRNPVKFKVGDGVNSGIPKWLPVIPDMSALKSDQKTSQKEERSDNVSYWNVDSCLVGEKRVVEKEKEKVKEKEKKKKGMELPAMRPRVRFKVGVGLGPGSMRGKGLSVDWRNRICRGKIGVTKIGSLKRPR